MKFAASLLMATLAVATAAPSGLWAGHGVALGGPVLGPSALAGPVLGPTAQAGPQVGPAKISGAVDGGAVVTGSVQGPSVVSGSVTGGTAVTGWGGPWDGAWGAGHGAWGAGHGAWGANPWGKFSSSILIICSSSTETFAVFRTSIPKVLCPCTC